MKMIAILKEEVIKYFKNPGKHKQGIGGNKKIPQCMLKNCKNNVGEISKSLKEFQEITNS